VLDQDLYVDCDLPISLKNKKENEGINAKKEEA